MRKAAQDEGLYCGADPQTIHEYERGRIPHPDPLRWLAVALGLPVQQLAMAARQQRLNRRRQDRLAVVADWTRSSTEEDATDRRQFGKLTGAGVAGMAAAPVLDTLNRIVRALERPSRIDEPLLDGLDERAGQLGDAYHGLPPESLIGPAREHLETTVRLTISSMTDLQRRRLCGIGADAAALVGVLSLLRDRQSDARAYFGLAENLAEASEDPTLKAAVLGLMSNVRQPTFFAWRGGDARPALTLFKRANALSSQAPARLRGWLLIQGAFGNASAGHAGASARALDEARTLLAGDPGDAEVRGFLGSFLNVLGDQKNLTTLEGRHHVLLGRGERAEAALLSALAGASPGRVRLPVFLLTDLGAAYFVLDAPEAATRALTEAHTLAARRGFAIGLQRIRNVRSRMPRTWAGLGCVRDLDERLAL